MSERRLSKQDRNTIKSVRRFSRKADDSGQQFEGQKMLGKIQNSPTSQIGNEPEKHLYFQNHLSYTQFI